MRAIHINVELKFIKLEKKKANPERNIQDDSIYLTYIRFTSNSALGEGVKGI